VENSPFQIGDLLIVSSSRKVFGRNIHFHGYEYPHKSFFARVGFTPLLILDFYQKNKKVYSILLLGKSKVITSLNWLNAHCIRFQENELTNKT
jgi:hypothetical protein